MARGDQSIPMAFPGLSKGWEVCYDHGSLPSRMHCCSAEESQHRADVLPGEYSKAVVCLASDTLQHLTKILRVEHSLGNILTHNLYLRIQMHLILNNEKTATICHCTAFHTITYCTTVDKTQLIQMTG